MSLSAALAAGPVVLDGGLATQLESAGADVSSALWSARLLHDDPDAVIAAHASFFAAGARVVTSASYQASDQGYQAAGLGPAAPLLRRSVALAARARADAGLDGRAWIAASVGPYGAVLADGSEYDGGYADECTSPRGVLPAVRAAAGTGLPVVGYPNSGEHWDAGARRWTGSAALDPQDVASWVAAGARLVGGCCRVGPAEVAVVAQAVSRR